MNVNAVSINEVFLANRTLKIPYFQRPYVWEEKNWERFYNDIAEIASATSTGEEEPETYFLGSIILKKSKFNGGQQLDVIDGQQRLTTIVVFMKALYLSLSRNDLFRQSFMQQDLSGEAKPILTPNHNDSLTYNEIIDAEILRTEPINTSKMAQAFAYFSKRIIDSRDGGDAEYQVTPNDLYSTIINYVRLVCIEVGKDENAQRIFETINCTGIKLTTGEMLKNYLFDETRVEEYERTWKRVFEGNNDNYWNKDVLHGRIEEPHINNFFYRYMLVKMQEPAIKRNLSALDVKRFRKKDGLYEKFKSLIEKNNLTIDNVISDVVESAEMYMKAFNNNCLDEAVTRFPGIERLATLMYAQDSWTMTPYILYILKSQPNITERQKIFGYMETYLVRRAFCRSKNNSYSDLFSEYLIGNGINTLNGLKSYIGNTDSALKMPTDKELTECIKNCDQKRNALFLLYMLESKLNEEFANSNMSNGYSDLMAEQVMPEKDNSAWTTGSHSTEATARLTKTIGNFMLLRSKLKASDKRAPWPRKRDAMRDRAAELTLSRGVCNGADKWNESIIEKRNEWIALKAIEVWPL